MKHIVQAELSDGHDTPIIFSRARIIAVIGRTYGVMVVVDNGTTGNHHYVLRDIDEWARLLPEFAVFVNHGGCVGGGETGEVVLLNPVHVVQARAPFDFNKTAKDAGIKTEIITRSYALSFGVTHDVREVRAVLDGEKVLYPKIGGADRRALRSHGGAE